MTLLGLLDISCVANGGGNRPSLTSLGDLTVTVKGTSSVSTETEIEQVQTFESRTHSNQVLALITTEDIKLIDVENNSVLETFSPTSSWGTQQYFSPNGKYIAYKDVTEENINLYLADLSKGEESLIYSGNVLDAIDDPVFSDGNSIAWSPSSDMLAFVMDIGLNREVFIFNLETKSIQNISENTSIDHLIDWSPTGEWILFVSDRDGLPQIFKISPTGGEITKLTKFNEYIFINFPTWSPDGERIAFSSMPRESVSGDIDIFTPNLYVIDSTGFNLREVLSNQEYSCDLCITTMWSPDSQSLIYISIEDQLFDIYSVDILGQKISQLSPDDNLSQFPLVWLPDSDKLVFLEGKYSYEHICITYILNWKCQRVIDLTPGTSILRGYFISGTE